MTSPAFAGPQEALSFYEQAQKAYEQSNYQKAADLLERAYAEDPNLIYQYNRILALQAAGKHEEALRLLNIYENPMRSDEEKRFEDISEIKARIEKSIKDQQSQVKDPVQDPVKDPIKDPVKDPIEDPKPKADDGPNILAWSLIGGGGALLVTGGLVGSGLFLPEKELANGQPNPDFNDSLNTQSTIAAVTLIGGGALAIGGIILLLLDDDAPQETQETGLQLTPYIGADGAGASMHWRF